MTETHHYDAVVIGSGQGGNPLATSLAKAGHKVAIVERQHVGGTCINYGCTPTKTMVASAKVAYMTRRSDDYGVNSGSVTVDMAKVRQRKRDIVESFRGGSEGRLERAENLDLLMGEASFTGLKELDEAPEHLLVLGGGYVGLEFAQMFRRFGSEVTIVQQGDQLLRREDADVAGAATEILCEDGIEVLLDAEAQRVERIGEEIQLTLSMPGGERTISGSHLLVAAGRVPNSEALNLSAAGVRTDEGGFVLVDDKLETSVEGIYALGDVKGGPAFTHISYDDHRVLKTNLIDGGDATISDRLLPYTVFIDPQLGRVGLSEWEARERGLNIRVAKMPMSYVARALEVDESRGLMKAVVDADTDQILGCAVLGIEGGEIAAMIQIAMLGKVPYTALRDAVFTHPTLAESLNNLFSAIE